LKRFSKVISRLKAAFEWLCSKMEQYQQRKMEALIAYNVTDPKEAKRLIDELRRKES
jgi:predicted secreted protein